MTNTKVGTDMIHVTKYLITCDKNKDTFKKLNKTLKKKFKIYKNNIELSNYKTNFDNDIFKYMVTFLKRMKENSDSNKKCYGILTDDNTILSDITTLQDAPNEWDILFLQYNLDKYDYLNTNNNIYWTKIKANDSKHFIINHESIDKVVNIIKNSKKWDEFINSISSNLNCYGINNYFLSKSNIFTNKPTQSVISNDTKYFEQFSNIFEKLSDENKYKILPSVSLISVVSDNKLFFNTIYTFLKLYYPPDKLELIIVIDDSIKFNDKNLPKDERIKIVNASNKNINNSQLPFGYKLNAGIKYSNNSLVCHLFDTNCYNTKYLYNLVQCLLISKKDCIISYDTGIYNMQNKKSYISKNFDINNMIYRKEFWKVWNFNLLENNKYNLLNEFMFFRYNCIEYVPFVNYSFNLNFNDKDFENNNQKTKSELEFSLRNLVDIKLEDSFIETFE